MIPCIMAMMVGLFFLWIPSQLGKNQRKVEQYGTPAVGYVMGINTLDGGDVRFAIRFTDASGVERTGQSQQFSRTYKRYTVGDSIQIKYMVTKTMGVDAVTIRVMDDQMKEGGTLVKTVLRVLGIIFLALGVVFLIL